MESSNVALADRIIRGTEYLVRSLNSDHGIPAVKLRDPSGCWTTAEGLLALLGTPWLRADLLRHVPDLVGFLLKTQLSGLSVGAWPLVVGGPHGSTMATAQAVMALFSAREALERQQADDASRAAMAGLQWLRDHQAEEGGWGVEPTAGPSGSRPRVVATFMALRALSAAGESVAKSRCVRLGVDWLWSVYDGQGFRPTSGHPADVCATVRAFWAVRACGGVNERPDFSSRTLDFVRSRRPDGTLWPIDTEVYIPDPPAHGQTVFNNNTTAEVLEFLIQVGEDQDAQHELVNWFQKHQGDDGSWCLGANRSVETDVVMWPTNEAVLALTGFLRSARFTPAASSEAVEGTGLSQRARSLLLWMFASLSIIEGFLLLGAPSLLRRAWERLPADYRTTFWTAAGMAVVLNLMSAAIIFAVKAVRRRWLRRRGAALAGRGAS